jgi:hypothetical protein
MPFKLTTTLLCTGLLTCASLAAQTISTIAGTGSAGYSGDGGTATSAQLNGPFGIAVDNSGNVYIADRNNNRLRKIDAAGTITTIAGTGTAGYNGDGGLATAAQLNALCGIAVDAAGNIYIADKGNSRIRKINSAGIITTIAGNSSAGYSGDGGLATSAQINNPRGVAIDAAANIYIADAGNHAVRRIDAGGVITTIAGTGTSGFSGDGGPAISAQLYGPYSVIPDMLGNIFIADVDNERIRKISPTGIISTVAGNGTAGYSGDGGPAIAAALYEPINIAADSFGSLYVADAWNARIRKISPSGTITTIAGNGTPGYSGDGGPAIAAQINNPYGITIKANALYISENANHRIRYVSNVTSVSTQPQIQSSTVVFPNPSAGQFTLQINTPAIVTSSVELVSINGAKIYSFAYTTNHPIVVKPELPAGIYFLRATTGNELLCAPIAIVIQ